MAYFGGLVVLLTIIGIVKKYDARLVLLVAGSLMAFAGGQLGGMVTAFNKTMVHGTLVPTICTVMGFSFCYEIYGM